MAVSRKQIHKALIKAKKHLARNNNECYWFVTSQRESYICYAIKYYIPNEEVVDATRDIIERRLAPCGSVPQWLERVAKVPEHLLTTDNVQAYRHRWLDSLIEEFSK